MTEVSTPWLSGNHTIFRQVSEKFDIIKNRKNGS
ncbi:MAG: hypothetical protein LE178_06695 [Endomicrobium sp.]|nr:hypothetical protein [Endomicrobium sp.]